MQLTEKEMAARTRVCLPLDELRTLDQVKQRVEELNPILGLVKIGKASYTRFGPAAITLAHQHGVKVFLDLKYHDIPNTVRDAAEAATEQGVYMFNVHASGGIEMMQAAMEGARNGVNLYGTNMPKVIGVTVLTSIDQKILNEQSRIPGTVEEQVLNLAKQTHAAGLDGIVCSAADLSAIRNHLPADFMYVTPGIQGPSTKAGPDQKRVFTPGNAIQDGSSILVVGRAITAGKTKEARLQAGYEILQDMAKYL